MEFQPISIPSQGIRRRAPTYVGRLISNMFFFTRKQWEDCDRESVASFLSLCASALPIITKFTCHDPSNAECIPSLPVLIGSRAELAEFRQTVQSIPSPKGKTFRKAKKDFEALLKSCEHASDWAVKIAIDPSRRGAFAGMIVHLTFVTELLKDFPQQVTKLRGHMTGADSSS